MYDVFNLTTSPLCKYRHNEIAVCFDRQCCCPYIFITDNLLGEKKLYMLAPEMRRLKNKMKVFNHLISNYTPSVLSRPFEKLGLTWQRRQL